MADVCNQSDCIIRIPHSEMEGIQEKESIMDVMGRENKKTMVVLNAHLC